LSIHVALHHETVYRYDRPVSLAPHLVRLRPASHCRTPILAYSLKVTPEEHFLNWQQDPYGNHIARFVFPNPTSELKVRVDLVADMTVINPFDFFLDEEVKTYPFPYGKALGKELAPYLDALPAEPRLQALVDELRCDRVATVDYLVRINSLLRDRVQYLIRMEPGVQTPEQTLSRASGSCRDSAWLAAQLLRHLGIASRFVSGYLIQLKPDVPSLDGPSGSSIDFTDLHAWAEAYIPGAGWIGLDPTSGLLAGEGHIPLAASADPLSAAAITGSYSWTPARPGEELQEDFDFRMTVSRIREDPRVTLPYTEEQWKAISTLGHQVDGQLVADDVRLTMGGEPTFVSIDDMDGEEWNVAALGENKRKLAGALLKSLAEKFAKKPVLHYGQGKQYPGEPLPRWALRCYWRADGHPTWRNPRLLAHPETAGQRIHEDGERFLWLLAEKLGVDKDWVRSAYEDVYHYLSRESKLPVDADVLNPSTLRQVSERERLARVFDQGLGVPTGYLLPLARHERQGRPVWVSGPWLLRQNYLQLVPGDAPMGYRLPLNSLPTVPLDPPPDQLQRDPFSDLPPLPRRLPVSPYFRSGVQIDAPERLGATSDSVVRTALCAEVRAGHLYVFLPPLQTAEDFLDLVEAIEEAAADLEWPIVLEGYGPPPDPRLLHFSITPDPGVLEVNIHPSGNWEELVDRTLALYEEARQCRLGTEKFMLDGRHSGTGGGNHLVLGGPTPADSPFLRRPDLLASMVGYWLNHPSLSYLFSSLFVGPTSQAPRLDEARHDSLYELEIALANLPGPEHQVPLWLVDRAFRHLLTDITGNTHRAEFCIDKLYSPDSTTGRLGLLELRSFEMPPHAQMSLLQSLLVRALVAWFWRQPFKAPLVRWGTRLHDEFMLGHFVWQDLVGVVEDLRQAGFPFRSDWFAPHFEFRFPRIGTITRSGVTLELRTAIEPWHVLGEEPGLGGAVRYVDSSLERLEVKVSGWVEGRHQVLCNGRVVPLRPTGVQGEAVAGVRYRAWQPATCLHPNIGVHCPLEFDLVDTWSARSLGGCLYRVAHPGGRNYESFPINANEAEARRTARFSELHLKGGEVRVTPGPVNPNFPVTLDLRRPHQC
jgi:uncharacterized protein (DUF2126 family)/transglutaminase-like putative cysteine protease